MTYDEYLNSYVAGNAILTREEAEQRELQWEDRIDGLVDDFFDK